MECAWIEWVNKRHKVIYFSVHNVLKSNPIVIGSVTVCKYLIPVNGNKEYIYYSIICLPEERSECFSITRSVMIFQVTQYGEMIIVLKKGSQWIELSSNLVEHNTMSTVWFWRVGKSTHCSAPNLKHIVRNSREVWDLAIKSVHV